MTKKLFFAIVLMTVATYAWAAPVEEAVAHRVAVNFWNTYRPLEVKPVEAMQPLAFDELRHMYVFANGTEGFVVISADDRVLPILGYSFDSPFPTRELNSELRYWLMGYESQIEAACASDRAADPRWGQLLSDVVPPTPLTLQNVPKLCHTQWNQTDPYNRQCPYDDAQGSYSVVGCVATAMAQIMKRWEHPSMGNGTHTYTHYNYGMLSVDFGNTAYEWNNMPNIASFASSDDEIRAVSTLSYHCGVAVDMNYSPQSSGAYSYCADGYNACAENAFRRYFKYEPSLLYRSRSSYPDSAWLAMIDQDLAEGRPMYYNGRDDDGGHAFVLDGSDLDTHYHFNWGWGGYGDGFYTMSNLAPGSGGVGGNSTYTFNVDQGAIFGIVPVPETYDTVEVWDTACAGTGFYHFRNYSFPVATCDTFLRYRDTMFYLHLTRVGRNIVTFMPNGAQGDDFDQLFCYVDGIVMPECPYTREGLGFRGWCENKRGVGRRYMSGDTVMLYGNMILYAVWCDTTVGVDKVDDSPIAHWPNPTSGEIHFILPAEGSVWVSVVDAAGHVVVLEQPIDAHQKDPQITLHDLPAGFYTVRLRTDEGVYNKVVIKQ